MNATRSTAVTARTKNGLINKVKSLFDYATTFKVAFICGGKLVFSEVPPKKYRFSCCFCFDFITKNEIMATLLFPAKKSDMFTSSLNDKICA